MQVSYISPSAMKEYLTCPKQYWFRRSKYTPRRGNTQSIGLWFHLAMEYLVEHNYSVAVSGHGEMWSFHQALSYVMAHPRKGDPPILSERGFDEVKMIGKKWMDGNPLPDWNQIHSTEVSFGPPGHKMRGKPVDKEVKFDSGFAPSGIIDLVYEDHEYVVVADYKTSKYQMKKEELADDVQAMIYALVIHEIIEGKRPIRVEFLYSRFPENGPTVWFPKDFKGIEDYLYQIQSRMRADNDPEATPGNDCRWCNYNYACEVFNQWTNTENGADWERMGSVELSEHLDQWADRKSSIDAVVKEQKAILLRRIQEDGAAAIGNWQLRFKRTPFYPEFVRRLIEQYGGEKNVPANYQIQRYAAKRNSSAFLWRDWRKRK